MKTKFTEFAISAEEFLKPFFTALVVVPATLLLLGAIIVSGFSFQRLATLEHKFLVDNRVSRPGFVLDTYGRSRYADTFYWSKAYSKCIESSFKSTATMEEFNMMVRKDATAHPSCTYVTSEIPAKQWTSDFATTLRAIYFILATIGFLWVSLGKTQNTFDRIAIDRLTETFARAISHTPIKSIQHIKYALATGWVLIIFAILCYALNAVLHITLDETSTNYLLSDVNLAVILALSWIFTNSYVHIIHLFVMILWRWADECKARTHIVDDGILASRASKPPSDIGDNANPDDRERS